MNVFKDKLVPAVIFAIFCLAVLSGCQGFSDKNPGVPGSTVMTDGVARDRYVHINAAIEAFNKSLGARTINLSGIPIAPSLYTELPDSEKQASETPQQAVQRLAMAEIVNSASYRLVNANTLTGRLEYRSEQTGAHLSVTVRAPSAEERQVNTEFMVTDMFGRASLAEIIRALPSSGFTRYTNSEPMSQGSTFLKVARGISDTTMLAYLNSLPAVERDRRDILGVRAILLIRMGQDAKAAKLVEKGIVRYPRSVTHFTLAAVLLERSTVDGSVPESLSVIMKKQFSRKKIRETRAQINQFLAI